MKTLIERLKDPVLYVDAIDEAISTLERLKLERDCFIQLLIETEKMYMNYEMGMEGEPSLAHCRLLGRINHAITTVD